MDILVTTATQLVTNATVTHAKTAKQMTAAPTGIMLTRVHASLALKERTAQPILTNVQASLAKTVPRATIPTRINTELNPVCSDVHV
jgi:hypothetical protein